MTNYRFVGDHADSLANGRPVAPGEYVKLSKEEINDHHNAQLIEDGKLIEVTPKDAKTAGDEPEPAAQPLRDSFKQPGEEVS